MTDTDLSALAAILAKRTPWEWTFKHERFRAACIYASDRNVILEDNGLHADNAAAIVAAVNALGPLLERVRELEVMLLDTSQWGIELAAANERIAGLEARNEWLSTESVKLADQNIILEGQLASAIGRVTELERKDR